MKVLVLGGNRYFGRRLVDLLLSRGFDVTVANRGSVRENFSMPVTQTTIERTSLRSMQDAFQFREFDIVFDQICFNEAEALIALETFKGRVKKYIFTSTSSVYSDGENRSEKYFDASVYDPDDSSNSDYQLGKRLAERTFLKADFPVTSVRIPVVIGQDDYTNRLLWHINKVRRGEEIFFPNINACYSFIHASDAANFLLWIGLKEDYIPTINAASPDSLRLIDLMSWIEDCTKCKATYAKSATPENHSPYGIDSDCTLSVDLATNLGFTFSRASNWLPNEISLFCSHHK